MMSVEFVGDDEVDFLERASMSSVAELSIVSLEGSTALCVSRVGRRHARKRKSGKGFVEA